MSVSKLSIWRIISRWPATPNSVTFGSFRRNATSICRSITRTSSSYTMGYLANGSSSCSWSTPPTTFWTWSVNVKVDSSLDFCWLPLSVLSLFSKFPFFLFEIFCVSCCAERWVCLFYSEWPALIRNISSCLSLSLTEPTKLVLAETSQQRQYQNETKETHTDEFRAF